LTKNIISDRLYSLVEVKHQDENFNTPLPPTAGTRLTPAFFLTGYRARKKELRIVGKAV
jgi:hypothetical protein